MWRRGEEAVMRRIRIAFAARGARDRSECSVPVRSARSSERGSCSPAQRSRSSDASAVAPRPGPMASPSRSSTARARSCRAAKVDYAIDAKALAPCDVVLCAVKSAQTKESGAELAKVVGDGALVDQPAERRPQRRRAPRAPPKSGGAGRHRRVQCRNAKRARSAGARPVRSRRGSVAARGDAVAAVPRGGRFGVEVPQRVRPTPVVEAR